MYSQKYSALDVLEIHFIELPKFSKEIQNIEDILHRWLLFLGNPNDEGMLNMLEEKDPVIRKATKVLHFLSSDPATVRLAELREKAIWDEVSNINGARAEGLQEGMQKGMQKGAQQKEIDIAIKMLDAGSPVEFISQITGLPIEEVRKLQH